MRGAAISILCSLGAVGLAGPVWAQGTPGSDELQLEPGGEPEELYGNAVAEAVGFSLVNAQRARRPEIRRLRAGASLKLRRARVELQGLVVERLRFRDGQDAQAYFEGLDLPTVKELDGYHVTTLEGVRASFELLDQVLGTLPDLPPEQLLPPDLGDRLGLRELRRETHPLTAHIPPNQAGAAGVRLEFQEGLRILRLQFEEVEDARRYLGREFVEGGERRICDQQGPQVLLLDSRFLDEVPFAARVLRAAWAGWSDPPGARETLGTWAAQFGGEERRGEFAALSLIPGGPLYQAGAEMLRAAREHDGATGSRGTIRWKFLDPETRNNVLFRRPDFYGGALVTPRSMLVAIGRDKPGFQHERDYLLALLQAIGQELPRRSQSMVELVGPR